MAVGYRADIDGLRAIAVIAVLFFHFGSNSFSGGYVGVDIFFVISGYLITSILVREHERGNFSIVRFYARRFRRILPALTVVMLFALAIGSLVLTADHFYDLGKTAVATSLFASNIIFYLASGYFDGPSELKPLLHTWSLAVEEQYYLLFPIILLHLVKLGAERLAKWLAVGAGLSFCVAVIAVKIEPSLAFYLLPARAWELLIGSLLAVNAVPAVRKPVVREVLSVIGLSMLMYGVFAYTPATVFPGVAATMPVLGAALIMHSGASGVTYVGRLLSSRPFVFVGLISYSLYLWHWPILVYAQYLSVIELSLVVQVLLFCVIFFLSVLSWKYVETPFRKIAFTDRDVFYAASVASVLILSLGLVVIMADGMPGRYKSDRVAEDMAEKVEWDFWGRCDGKKRKLESGDVFCNLGSDVKPSFILWGDSHARALAPAVDRSAKRHGAAGEIAVHSGCPPLLDIERPGRTSCKEFNDGVLRYIAGNPELGTVILTARWALSANGARYKRESGTGVELVDLQSDDMGRTNSELVEVGLMRTVERLQELGRRVILVGPVPEVGYDVPSANFVSSITGRDVNAVIAPSVREFHERAHGVSSILALIAKNTNSELIRPADDLCNGAYCRVAVDSIPLYRDDDHLSVYGAKYISRVFDPIFSGKINIANR